MNVSVEDLSPSQKRLHIEIPAPEVQQAIEKRYRDLAKQVRIKGFRPGKVPRNILKSYYGKSIEHEITSQFIEESFPQALRDSDIKPLVEAEVDETKFDENGALVYAAIVEVCPPFDLIDYKGLPLRRTAAQVTEEQEQAELERIRQQHAELKTIDTERGVRYGDLVTIEYRSWSDGESAEEAKRSEQIMEVGKNILHPDFDEHLVGHFAGDNLTFELERPEGETPSEAPASQLHFEVTIREVKEKRVPELNDEFAQTVGQFETLDQLKAEIAKQLQLRQEEQNKGLVRQQIADLLLEKIQFEVPVKAVEKEIEHQLRTFQYQFESQGLKLDASKFDTPEIRAEYRPQAEKNIRLGLILSRVAEQEGFTLSDDEIDEIFQNVARMARMPVEEVKKSFANSPIVDEAKEGKLKEKVFELIETQATYSESPAEAVDSTQQE